MIKRLVQGAQPSFAAWVAVAVLAGTPAVWAQSSATPSAAQPAARVPPANAPVPTASAPRAATDLRIIEDEQVRIEETRVRGQLQRITVAPKGGTLKPYEIIVGAGGRDPSQDKSGAGQRVWSVLRF